MRGSVIFDECGFLTEEMLEVYGAFAAVNKDFATGKDRNGKDIDPSLYGNWHCVPYESRSPMTQARK